MDFNFSNMKQTIFKVNQLYLSFSFFTRFFLHLFLNFFGLIFFVFLLIKNILHFRFRFPFFIFIIIDLVFRNDLNEHDIDNFLAKYEL